jgi:hypothetical protein
MKTLRLLTCILLPSSFALAQQPQGEIKRERQKFAQIVTTKGTTYKDVEVSRVTPIELRIMHAAGIAAVPLADLPRDLQDLFGYNPIDADAEMKARAAQRVEDLVKAERDKVESIKLREQQQAESIAISAIEKKGLMAEVQVIEKRAEGCLCRVWKLEQEVVKGQATHSGKPVLRLVKSGEHQAFVIGLDAGGGQAVQLKLMPVNVRTKTYATTGSAAYRAEREGKAAKLAAKP